MIKNKAKELTNLLDNKLEESAAQYLKVGLNGNTRLKEIQQWKSKISSDKCIRGEVTVDIDPNINSSYIQAILCIRSKGGTNMKEVTNLVNKIAGDLKLDVRNI